ncbi:hypothetical protein FB451DRAFT_1374648 [Mycena latifolia]|nr:hypothetical protein FB451DRAFT_1374648 [Mycena latifolia]
MLFTLIFMPFVGALVRYRANYTPKTGGVYLDGEEGVAAAPSTDSPSYFGMLQRVHRIEGWGGLYKGIMPAFITGLIATIVISPITVLMALGHIPLPVRTGLDIWAISFAMSVIPVLLLVPMYIITNRAITTPHKLVAFDAPAALRILLTPAERAQPLRLYLAPGVAAALVLEALIGPILALANLHAFARLPLLGALGAGLPALALATMMFTPLEVMLARLTLQRLGPDEGVGGAEAPVYAEAVMEFRTGADSAPYTGVLDCARKITDEEGARVLFRAWWLTLLVMILPLLAPMLGPPVI